MRIGYEDPTFFAVDTNGSEVTLTLAATVSIDTIDQKSIPIH
jgi:hypothetical protein